MNCWYCQRHLSQRSLRPMGPHNPDGWLCRNVQACQNVIMKREAKRKPKALVEQNGRFQTLRFQLDPERGMVPLVRSLVPPDGYRFVRAERKNNWATFLYERID